MSEEITSSFKYSHTWHRKLRKSKDKKQKELIESKPSMFSMKKPNYIDEFSCFGSEEKYLSSDNENEFIRKRPTRNTIDAADFKSKFKSRRSINSKDKKSDRIEKSKDINKDTNKSLISDKSRHSVFKKGYINMNRKVSLSNDPLYKIPYTLQNILNASEGTMDYIWKGLHEYITNNTFNIKNINDNMYWI